MSAEFIDDLPLISEHHGPLPVPFGATPGRTEVVIVPNDGTRPRYEHLQTWTFKEGGKEWQNVEVSQFFPGGYITVVVARFPNGSPLPWPVRIYIDNHRSECPYNDVFQSVFQREWMGNVVIAKYSKTQTAKKRAFSATYERGETAWIMYAVAEYLSSIWRRAFGEGN